MKSDQQNKESQTPAFAPSFGSIDRLFRRLTRSATPEKGEHHTTLKEIDGKLISLTPTYLAERVY